LSNIADFLSSLLEDWEIWLRWESAFKEGRTTQETHPALPEERARHHELEVVLTERLVIESATSKRAKAEFKFGNPTLVKWSVIS
jgi:hypothetical protein